ncbi:MAG: alpha/beta fold hydrolase BchO [Pseudomonadota bacterium]
MRWESDGRDWPNREASRFVAAGPHLWHVQRLGEGPPLVLLHGAGGSTHSWRDVAPTLAEHYDVIAVDLPGQGFTRLGSRSRCGLEAMAEDLRALLLELDVRPAALVGHSAGAAIALRMALDLEKTPRAFVALNGAFEPFNGVAGFMFPMTARLLAMNPFAGFALSRMAANAASVRGLIAATGSRLDDAGVALYGRLLADPSHLDATIAMMARWSLEPTLRAAEGLRAPALLLTGAQDLVVPPAASRRLAERLEAARHVSAPGFGHLHHEEAPEEVAAQIHAHVSAHLEAPPKRRRRAAGA